MSRMPKGWKPYNPIINMLTLVVQTVIIVLASGFILYVAWALCYPPKL